MNVRNPHSLQMIMDSLRYWVTEMHVDGFRFDLASSLAREFHEVDKLSTFFDLVQQDPVVSQAKLIAEPWDLGEGGYQVGNFPSLWTEWNGKYRDTTRDYWRGEHATLPEFASRFTGSSDLYLNNGRSPHASINFVTAHDGFTLADLVSYNDKHNDANGEDGRDGESHNRSWNCGVEGPTRDRSILALRARQRRNIMVTLLLSQGVPMIAHGDEIGRTQKGNNNTYCQDNELSWMDWDAVDEDMLTFTRFVIGLRRRHPIFRRRRFFEGKRIAEWDKVPDISWLQPNAEPMTARDWQIGYAKTLTVVLNGSALNERDRFGRPQQDKSFALFFNAADHPDELPDPGSGRRHGVGRGAGHRELAGPRARGPRDLQRRRASHGAVALGRGAPGDDQARAPSHRTRSPGAIDPVVQDESSAAGQRLARPPRPPQTESAWHPTSPPTRPRTARSTTAARCTTRTAAAGSGCDAGWSPGSIVLFWLFVVGPLGSFAGQLSDVQENDAAGFLPASAESTQVRELSQGFSTSDTLPAIVVYEFDRADRPGGPGRDLDRHEADRHGPRGDGAGRRTDPQRGRAGGHGHRQPADWTRMRSPGPRSSRSGRCWPDSPARALGARST